MLLVSCGLPISPLSQGRPVVPSSLFRDVQRERLSAGWRH
jgi:hypothetical protein